MCAKILSESLIKRINHFVSIFVLTLFIYIIPFATEVFGQNIQVLEEEYSRVNAKLSVQKTDTDSLRTLLEAAVTQIDREKNKKDPENARIRSLMAQNIKITDQIEKTQREIEITEDVLNGIRKQLSRLYRMKIDSLKKITAGSEKFGSGDEVQREILNLSQKKLLIQPDPPLLFFDPQKIMDLDITSAQDEPTRKLYSELIRSALTEVRQKRKNVNETMSELKNLSQLQTRAQRFIERSDLAAGPPGGGARVSENAIRTNSEPTFSTDGSKLSVAPQFDSYLYMWHQLDQLPSTRKRDWISPVDSTNFYSDPAEFTKLLSDLEERLHEYEAVLEKMLNLGH